MGIRIVGPGDRWPFGGAGDGANQQTMAGFGLARIRRQPAHLRNFAGATGERVGQFAGGPSRLSDNAVRRDLSQPWGIDRGDLSTLEGFGAPLPPAQNAPTEVIQPATLAKPGAKVGPFMFNEDGGTINTTVARLYRQAPGAADDLFKQVMRVSDALATPGQTAIPSSYLVARWGPISVEGQDHPAHSRYRRSIVVRLVDGTIPLYRVKHRNQDWGVYITLAHERDARGDFGVSLTFKPAPKQTWLQALWDSFWSFLKELVVDIIRFVADAIRDILKSIFCVKAKALLTELADVADGKRTLTAETRAQASAAGISSAQLTAFVSGNVYAAAFTSIADLVQDRLCGEPPPPPEVKSSGSGGIVIAAVAAAALFFVFR